MVGRLFCVLKIVTPFLWTSTMMLAPTGAEPTEARTAWMGIARPGYQRQRPGDQRRQHALAGKGNLLAVLGRAAVAVVAAATVAALPLAAACP